MHLAKIVGLAIIFTGGTFAAPWDCVPVTKTTTTTTTSYPPASTITVHNTVTTTQAASCPSAQVNVCGNPICCNALKGKVDCVNIKGSDQCTGTVLCCNAQDSMQVCIGNIFGDKVHVNIHQHG